jgi:hypothetical protein
MTAPDSAPSCLKDISLHHSRGAQSQVQVGATLSQARDLLLAEGLQSFQARNYTAPKTVDGTGNVIGNTRVMAAAPILRILYVGDRTDHVSSGQYGVEGAVLWLLASVNDIAGPRLINKNPNARGCSAAPGYFGIVAALVFPQGIEDYGWRVKLGGQIQPPLLPKPLLCLPAPAPHASLAPSRFDAWMEDAKSEAHMWSDITAAYQG